MSMLNLFFFLAIVGYVAVWNHYLIGFLLVFILMCVEVMCFGMTHAMFLVLCELTAAIFLVREGQTKKEKSPLVKYNPFCKNNVLPKKIRTIILSVFILAIVIRLIDVFFPMLRK